MYFCRFGETVHHHFHKCLQSVLSLHEDCVPRLSCQTHQKISSNATLASFSQECIGAIDDTHITIPPPSERALAFINKHGDPAQNVLETCNFNLKFTYILASWEGRMHNVHVLQDALKHSTNRLTIPRGHYYLMDVGYPHVPSFMAPYKCISYNMSNFGPGRSPRNNEELFNFRHARLRSTAERLFAV